MRHWALSYIGQPWTPQRNCWYWFRRIQQEVFGIEVPEFGEVAGDDYLRQVRLFQKHEERRNWLRVEGDPRDGDAMLLALRRHTHHIGVIAAVDGGIGLVHALEGSGVVYTALPRLSWFGWKLQGIYRHGSHRPSV